MKDAKISEIKVGKRIRKDLGDIDDLWASIEQIGLLHPIVIDPQNKLIAGRRRLEAYKKQGRETIPAHVIDVEDATLAEVHENIKRCDLTPSERVEAGRRIKPRVEAEARERGEAGKGPDGSGGRGKKKPSGNFPEGLSDRDARETRNVVGAVVGLSGRSFEKAEAVVDAARENPTQFAAAAEGMDRTGKIDRAYRAVADAKKKAAHEAAVAKGEAVVDLEAEKMLQVTNLWRFQECDARFGAEHPGRVPGQVIANLLHYFTEEGDLVVDPFAGSGTTIDVCEWMRRKCLAYDVTPVRKDVKKRDAADGLAKEARGATIIYLDPPYWRQFDEDEPYSKEKADLANLKWHEYEKAMTVVLQDALESARVGGCVAAIASQTQVKGRVIDLPFLFERVLDRAGGEFAAKIVVPFAQSQFTGPQTDGAKKGRYVLKAYRELIVFRRTK